MSWSHCVSVFNLWDRWVVLETEGLLLQRHAEGDTVHRPSQFWPSGLGGMPGAGAICFDRVTLGNNLLLYARIFPSHSQGKRPPGGLVVSQSERLSFSSSYKAPVGEETGRTLACNKDATKCLTC